MKVILITGSGGLVGREAAEFYLKRGYTVVGIDNNMRESFFGEGGSVLDNLTALVDNNKSYRHHSIDIRNTELLKTHIFKPYGTSIVAIIHCAAQPSHDWAVNDPFADFNINATATLGLLELTREYCKDATFVFMSTNKVYGDNPNLLPLKELDTRWELPDTHQYYDGLPETFSIDGTKHSLFGCSKLSADVYVQEYGKYFGMNTVVFRGGCLTGSKHKGAELHGFLNYLVRCNLKGITYKIYGYKGKQVRDNIHSSDLVKAFDEVIKSPRSSEVYNIGGGRFSNCSMMEAITTIEIITGKKTNVEYVKTNRIGDHIWWISDTTKFKSHYPNWVQEYQIENIISEIVKNVLI